MISFKRLKGICTFKTRCENDEISKLFISKLHWLAVYCLYVIPVDRCPSL